MSVYWLLYIRIHLRKDTCNGGLASCWKAFLPDVQCGNRCSCRPHSWSSSPYSYRLKNNDTTYQVINAHSTKSVPVHIQLVIFFNLEIKNILTFVDLVNLNLKTRVLEGKLREHLNKAQNIKSSLLTTNKAPLSKCIAVIYYLNRQSCKWNKRMGLKGDESED